ncbi:MAG: DUF975 family protein [Agathobacter sp.]|nr:DUF975 family protein [Agathobacter sp.]
MWTRVQLKDKAKGALDINYWKIILVSLIVVLVGGGTASSAGATFEEEFSTTLESEDMDIFNDLFSEEETWEDESDGSIADDEYSQWYEDPNASDEYWEGYYDGYFGNSESAKTEEYLAGYKDGQLDDTAENDFGSAFEDGFSSGELDGISMGQIAGIGIVVVVIFILIVVIVSAIGLVYSAFILNPVDVGAKRFFVKSLDEAAEVKEIAFAFDNNYKNVAKILFVRDLKVLLWTLLFIIPGVIKSYEYFMMPYLLAENPNLTKEEAFRLSKQMMTGNKWKTFVLELSFFWWDVLSAITAGIVGIFYVNPYKNLTFAALYEELSVINGRPARAAAVQPMYEMPVYEQEVEPAFETSEETYNSPE